MNISDISITGPFRVYDVQSGQYIFSFLDQAGPGDIPPDIAALPVLGLWSVHSDTVTVLYIDTICR